MFDRLRRCAHPTTEQLLRLFMFSMSERHELLYEGYVVQHFATELTEAQRQVLRLLDVPSSAYAPARAAF